MKIKMGFFNKRVRKQFSGASSIILSLFSVLSVFISFENSPKCMILAILIFINALAYVFTWSYCNRVKKADIKIRNTRVIIKEGDLFEEKGKKVIGFNEYFDTQVDDIIIAKKSLNGVFIHKYIKNVSDLDEHIEKYLSTKTPKKKNYRRSMGKKVAYDLGTIVPYGEFLLLAYSEFDENDRARLSKEKIFELYLKMWDEIDIIRAYDSICLPLLGSSRIVRDINLTDQQLLELILWSFRISEINLTKNATLTIVIDKTMVDDIDFYKLKDYSD